MDSNNSSSNNNNGLDYDERLCHVIKRSDFDGYGFNLHAEKGRPGQYIGKVDPNSPAELAGLREGDRIIEVNSVNIKMETHKQVVERIKMLPNETKLLVIDPRAKINDQNEIVKKDLLNNNNTNNINNNNSSNENKSPSNSPATASPPTTPVTSSNNNSKASPPVTPTSAPETKKTLTPATVPVVPIPVPVPTVPSAEQKPAPPQSATAAPAAGAAPAAAPAPATQAKNPLKLPMTAAEMRAQLANKKKYDPKNDTSELRKKYDMLQKL